MNLPDVPAGCTGVEALTAAIRCHRFATVHVHHDADDLTKIKR